MGNLKTFKKRLREKNVWIAKETQKKKIEFYQMLVKKRIEEDAEFAQDVLNAVGEDLPAEFKEAAEKTIQDSKEKSNQEVTN